MYYVGYEEAGMVVGFGSGVEVVTVGDMVEVFGWIVGSGDRVVVVVDFGDTRSAVGGLNLLPRS